MPTLDWIGKRAVVNHHRELPYRLLHCDPTLGAGDPAAGNLLVEGDNLHALKALLPYYAGRVKCIYIDPPYNTGDESWVYNDKVTSPEIEKWLGDTVGKEAEDLSRHDKWLCMMYPRLALLREFLREDGVIFISLDDNEAHRFRMLADEIFAPQNFVEQMVWKKSYGGGAKERFVVRQHEYCFLYARDKRNLADLWLPPDPDAEERYYKYRDAKVAQRGPFRVKPLEATKSMGRRENLVFPIKAPDGSEVMPKRQWWWSRERVEAALANDDLHFVKTKIGWSISYKQYLRDENGEERGAKPFSVIDGIYTQEGTADLRALFDDQVVLQFPKPIRLVKQLIQMVTKPGDLILDSFAGSGTTGHAVLALNAEAKAAHTESNEDTEKKQAGGKPDLFSPSLSSVCDPPPRRFILCELEPKIAREITAERLRRVIAGYSDTPGLGGGFRFCTLGEPLLDADARFHPEVQWCDLGHHLWFAETGEPMEWRKEEGGGRKKGSALLGIAPDGRAIYLLAGKLSRAPAGVPSVLTAETLAQLTPHAGPRVVYGEACTLRASALARERIVFKQIPYQVRQQ